jgi:hypothetical protein
MHGLTPKMVFQSHLEIEMMINRKINVLKGQHILAQGNALGLGMGEIVRGITFIKEKFLFRTGVMTLCFPKMMSFISVRRKLIALLIEFSRTVFLLNLLPRAAFRIVPPETLPWAIIYWPFRPEKTLANDFWKSSWTKPSK